MTDYADFTIRDAERIARATRAYEGGMRRPPAQPQPQGKRNANRVSFMNTLETLLDKGSVIEFTAHSEPTLIEEDVMLLDGVEPNAERAGWGIVAHHTPAGEQGNAYVSGPCVALVDVTSTDHQYAVIENGETVLKSAESGPVVLLHEVDETGEQLCVVNIDRQGGEQTVYLGFTDEVIPADDAATVSIYEGTAGSETDSGDNVEAFNHSPGPIAADTWVIVVNIAGEWYAIPLATPSERNVVMWSGNSVLEGPAAGRWATDDFGYVKFLGRYGNADAGITFDSTEATPSSNGNMTVTRDGMYLFHLSMEFSKYGPTWSSGGTGYAEGQFNLRYKRAGGFTNTGIQAGDWVAEPYVLSDVEHTAAASGLFPLLEGDVLHVQLQGSTHNSGDNKTFTLSSFDFVYERVGEYVDVVTA